MAVPSLPYSLVDALGEFDLSSGSLRDLLRGGANVPDSTTNASVPSSGTISLSQLAGASDADLAYSGATHSSNSASGHTLTFTLSADGTWDGTSSINGLVASGNWIDPTSEASDCAVTATFISESTFTGTPAHTGTFGSSLALTSDRAWSQTVASDPADASTLVFDLDFTINGNALGSTQRVTLNVG